MTPYSTVHMQFVDQSVDVSTKLLSYLLVLPMCGNLALHFLTVNISVQYLIISCSILVWQSYQCFHSESYISECWSYICSIENKLSWEMFFFRVKL